MYVMGDLKLPALFLFLVSTLAIVISLLGLSFPYSAVNQCPKRVFFQVSVLRKWSKSPYSLRADEIKLWLTPSAKQRQNLCSRLPAVYPDLSTHHDWPVKKGLCFVCRDRQSG